MADLDALVAELGKLTVLEAAELATKLEEEWGVSAAAPAGGMMMMASPDNTSSAEAAEEKTEFDLVLESFPADKKIAVLKIVRELTGLGLKEAKELVESAPKTIKEAIAKEAAEDAKKRIEEVGGKVAIK